MLLGHASQSHHRLQLQRRLGAGRVGKQQLQQLLAARRRLANANAGAALKWQQLS